MTKRKSAKRQLIEVAAVVASLKVYLLMLEHWPESWKEGQLEWAWVLPGVAWFIGFGYVTMSLQAQAKAYAKRQRMRPAR